MKQSSTYHALTLVFAATAALLTGCRTTTLSVDETCRKPVGASRILVVSGLREDSGDTLSVDFMHAFERIAANCGLQTASVTLVDYDVRREPLIKAREALSPQAVLIARRAMPVTDEAGNEVGILYRINLYDPNGQDRYWCSEVSIKYGEGNGKALAASVFERMQQAGALKQCSKKGNASGPDK